MVSVSVESELVPDFAHSVGCVSVAGSPDDDIIDLTVMVKRKDPYGYKQGIRSRVNSIRAGENHLQSRKWKDYFESNRIGIINCATKSQALFPQSVFVAPFQIPPRPDYSII